MTMASKVLVLVNIFMGTLFLGFAAFTRATRLDYAAMLTTAKQEVSVLQKEQTRLKEDVGRLGSEKGPKADQPSGEPGLEWLKTHYTAQKEQYAQQVEQLEAELKNRNDQVVQTRTEADEVYTQLKEAGENQTTRRKEVQELLANLAELNHTLDNLHTQNAALANELAQTQGLVELSQARVQTLDTRLAELQKMASTAPTR